ncbi:glycine-rich domain-containing protein [Enterobacter asburiae]
MANLPETPQWEEGIYQIEVSDPVLGGPDGISNRQGKQLASRTLYLKQQVEKGGTDLAKHIAAADPHTQYAPKASPTFTGTPTAPTPANSDNSKKLATTEFVAKALAALAGSAPKTLDTLKELADALGNDPNFATTVLNKLAEKLAKDQNGADIPDPVLFVKNLGLGDGTGRLINVQTFTASGTYKPTTGTKFVIAEVLGGGGGGGSNAATPSSGAAAGAGGASGSYAVCKHIPTGPVSVVIGAGGSGGVPAALGADGSTGGTTSFGAVSAPGGYGGPKGVAFNNFPTGGNVATGSAPVSGSVIVSSIGSSGSYGILYSDSNATGGGGGSSNYGAGGVAMTINAGGSGTQRGMDANGYGSGGGGAVSVHTSTAASSRGGNGAPGIVIIWEYA